MNRFGIYIHIPFCKKKCDYCDFISFSDKNDLQEKYVNSLLKEIEYRNVGTKEKVDTIYFGGGTPSFIDAKYIEKIMNEIKNKYNISENAEITLEVNPGTANKEKLEEYKRIGINRLSIGLQSTSDRLLKLIGRIHTYEEFREIYDLARKTGFNNINVDLMLALPTQTMDELNESVEKVIDLKPEHISVYSLILEEGTPLEKKISSGELSLIDEELERKMYWGVKNKLKRFGYNHYEISNFSIEGKYSNHNMDCWNQEDYVGYGLASHSYIDGKRVSNTDDINKYIYNIESNNIDNNLEVNEVQDRESMAKEYMMLGFRKIEGVSISEFERKFHINPLFYFRFEIEKLTNEELIEVDLDNIKLTSKGLDFANLVFEEFI